MRALARPQQLHAYGGPLVSSELAVAKRAPAGAQQPGADSPAFRAASQCHETSKTGIEKRQR
jgi:hypothetical protein